jgi:hypothetical protein
MVKLEAYAENLQKHLRIWIMLTSACFPIVKHTCKVNSIIYAMNRRKLGWRLTFPKTEELRVNTKSQRSIMLANKAIRRVHDFTYHGSTVRVSEDGGTRKDVETRIQKAR